MNARIRLRRLRNRARHALGEGRRRLAGVPAGPQSVLLVLGCQRSGTTLMTELFERDPEAKVYPEYSAISRQDADHGLRLAELDRVARHIGRSRYPLVVLKPLVESQNAAALLAGLPRARGLWMFRHYADVARSNLARFGERNGIRNLRSIARGTDDWRGEGASEAVARVIGERFSEQMDPHDAAALFWWARNALFFERGLETRRDVLTCRYEELVCDPVAELRRVYAFAERPPPASLEISGVSEASVGRGRSIPFSQDVVALCEEMLGRLEKVHGGGTPCA